MYFNSTVFLGFLIAFLLVYSLCRHSLVLRNRMIVLASYFFYGWWDWRFTGLLLLSSLVDFYAGSAMGNASPKGKRRLLGVSLAVNLGALGCFKYYNFFIENVHQGLRILEFEPNLPVLQVILPVGISFYTFQSLSYTIDVYRDRLRPQRDLTAFLAYVSFFPQLVAGPIERAPHLLPQFLSLRRITSRALQQGTWLILWGLFKKVVVADNLAPLVDMVYADPRIEGPIIVAATIAFGFQIYCDFSGYSDIARGIAFLLGFELMLNFNLPYFARTPSEFWRRWHISLSTWFRDYLYIPLGGNRGPTWVTKRNLLITMLVAGLWHGAGWNFILWGAWHGIILIGFARYTPQTRATSIVSWGMTMSFVFFGWLLFRAQSLDQIQNYTMSFWYPVFPEWTRSYLANLGLFTLPIITMQCWQYWSANLTPSLRWHWFPRTMFHGIILYGIVLFWDTRGTPFIYFQF